MKNPFKREAKWYDTLVVEVKKDLNPYNATSLDYHFRTEFDGVKYEDKSGRYLNLTHHKDEAVFIATERKQFINYVRHAVENADLELPLGKWVVV